MTVFSESLQKLRKAKSLTQIELAENLGVSPQAVSKWENGSYLDADFIPKVANFFEVTIDELYGRSKKKESIEEQIFGSMSFAPDNEESKIKEYFDKFLEYFWAALNGSYVTGQSYIERQVMDDMLYGSMLITSEGIVVQSNRKAYEFGMVMKKSEKGFGDMFSDKEKMAEVFKYLSDVDNLKILEYMFSLCEGEVLTSKVISLKLKIIQKKIEDFFDFFNILCNWTGAVKRMELVREDNTTEKGYSIELGNAAVLMMIFALTKMVINPTSSFMPLMKNFPPNKKMQLIEKEG